MKQAKISLLAYHYRTYTGCIKKGDHLIFINIRFVLKKKRHLALGVSEQLLSYSIGTII